MENVIHGGLFQSPHPSPPEGVIDTPRRQVIKQPSTFLHIHNPIIPPALYGKPVMQAGD